MAVKLMVRDLDDPQKCRVEGTGFDIATVDDKIARAFGLRRETGYDPKLWEASKYIFGRPPNDMWLSDPTGGQFRGKGYEINEDWEPVVMRRTFRSAKILSLDTTPEILAAVRHDNSKSSVAAPFNASLSREVANSLEISEETSLAIGISHTVGVEVGSEASGVKAKAETTISTEASRSQGKTEGKTKTLTAGQGVEVTVPAGKIMRSVLYAAFGQAAFLVYYDVELSGDAYFYFKKAGWDGKGHHRTVPVQELLRVMRDAYNYPAPAQVTASARVEIGVFGDSYTALEDVA